MVHWKGDVHGFYQKLKRRYGDLIHINDVEELDTVRSIRTFYEKFDAEELKNVRAKMKKEQTGIGMIPLVTSSLPLSGLVFGDQIRSWISQYGAYSWVWMLVIYAFIVVVALAVHYHQKACASLHLTIIDEILTEKQQE